MGERNAFVHRWPWPTMVHMLKGNATDTSLVFLRLVLAATFIRTGYTKLTGLEGVEGFFGSLGVPAPGLFAVLVGVAELFGGLGILLGVAPRFSGAVLALVMVVAVTQVTWPAGGWDSSRLEFLLMATGLTVALNGPGKLTLPGLLGKPDLDLESMVWAKMRKGA